MQKHFLLMSLRTRWRLLLPGRESGASSSYCEVIWQQVWRGRAHCFTHGSDLRGLSPVPFLPHSSYPFTARNSLSKSLPVFSSLLKVLHHARGWKPAGVQILTLLLYFWWWRGGPAALAHGQSPCPLHPTSPTTPGRKDSPKSPLQCREHIKPRLTIWD